jgi:hypothetical protein
MSPIQLPETIQIPFNQEDVSYFASLVLGHLILGTLMGIGITGISKFTAFALPFPRTNVPENNRTWMHGIGLCTVGTMIVLLVFTIIDHPSQGPSFHMGFHEFLNDVMGSWYPGRQWQPDMLYNWIGAVLSMLLAFRGPFLKVEGKTLLTRFLEIVGGSGVGAVAPLPIQFVVHLYAVLGHTKQ